jgi:hypothetical protein
MQTFSKNPGRTMRKIESVLGAWENLAPESEFHEMKVSEFRAALQPAFDVRERIRTLEIEMAGLMQKRLLIDEKCHRLALAVVNSVRGTPEHGANSPLYAAMGYIPDANKKSGRPRKARPAPDISPTA